MNDIRKAIDELRSKYEVLQDNKLPIDIFTFAEVDLGLNLIPFDDLKAKYDVDAALQGDFSAIYVDAEQYDLMERGPIWKLRRLRFSLAHELGHFYLHKDHPGYVSAVQDFTNWTNSNSSEKYRVEMEANEFAGALLVPTQRLKELYSEFEAKASSVIPNFKESETLRSGFCESATGVFQVGTLTIGIRLDRDLIWEAN